MRTITPILIATLLLTGCHSTFEMVEYMFEWDETTYEPFYEEASFDKLPPKAITYLSDCYSQENITYIHTGKLYYYNETAYYIYFADTSDMIFDKKGNCIGMDKWRPQGLTKCMISKVPNVDAMQQIIAEEMARISSNPWDIRCIEIHHNGYLFKVGIEDDIFHFAFDKKGKLQYIAVEI